MKPPYTYQIRHIQLDKKDKLPLVPTPGSGWYLVFWWKQIPVGHVFLEPGDPLDQDALLAEVESAVEPTIKAYKALPLVSAGAGSVDNTTDEPPALTDRLKEVMEPFDTASMPAQVPLSIVICTRNRSAELQATLQSLQSLRCRPEEIIVVDNAPTDNSTGLTVRQFADVTYCVEPTPGLDYARNKGIRMATKPILAYVDDDVIVHPDWVYQVWQSFAKPEVMAMTGLVIAAELQSEAQLIFEQHWSFNRGYADKYFDTAYFTDSLATGPPVWEIGAGANMAFRRSIFDEVGYFDERLGAGASGCGDDSEMWFRILARGYTIHYNPRAVSFHKHRRELTALKKQLFSYMRGHVVAALIQQEQNREAGYKKRIFREFPIQYYWLLRVGFPFFRFRHRTILVELKGIISGLLFYRKHRKRPAQLANQ